MRNVIVILLILSLIPLPLGFPQDNQMYGEYLIASTQKIISLDLEGANLMDVLKMLSQQTSLNFISTEAVKDRSITLYLEKVPLKEALDVIFKANNLAYDYYPEGNMFVVKEMGKPAIELKTKVYRLKYVRIRSSRMQKEIKDKMETTGTSGTQTGSGTSSSSSTSSTSGGTQDKDLGIKSAIEKVLTEFGKVSEDPITNSIIVVDVPSQFTLIDEMIANLDIPIPKVLIEAEMLDVSKGLVDKMGFKYGSTTDYNGDITAAYTGVSRQTAFPFGDYRHFDSIINPTAGPTLTYGSLTMGGFNAMMQFLQTDTTTRTLARPKILTLSNETAEVNITTDEAIGVTSTTVETTTTQSVERTETGTKLRVTPQVNLETKEITLFVEVFTREATEGNIRVTGMTSGNVKNPEERATRTTLRLKDNETLLIGGLIKKKNTDAKTKIPFLGDLPLIGGAFRYKSKQDEDRELLVFLTPRIIEDAPVLKTAERKPTQREQYFSRKDSIDVALDKFSNY